MKTMWQINRWAFGDQKKIAPVEIEKETDHFVVTVNNRRVAKQGDFFDSFDEAKAFLVERAKMEVRNRQEAFERAKADLAKYEALQP